MLCFYNEQKELGNIEWAKSLVSEIQEDKLFMSSVNVEELYEFIDKDYLKTLFPLGSVKFFAKYCMDDILMYINREIFKEGADSNSFIMQPLVYALKDNRHVRQTFLLEPFAQIFLYDFVYRNKTSFIMKINENRKSFGYSFNDDKYNSSDEFKKFTEKKYELKSRYEYMGKIDITNCFNNIYHHDIVSYISMLINQDESKKIGKFLREINGGRSTNCMPQGLFPAKVIGNFYLSFIENSRELKCEYIIRFMDDIYLFSNDQQIIIDDILIIQRLIGEKGLYLNEEKTKVQKCKEDIEKSEIEDSKKSLLQKRRQIINGYTGEVEDIDVIDFTSEETDYLKHKLEDAKHLSDEDIELLLSVLSASEEESKVLIELVIHNFPHLTKNLYFSVKRNLMYLNQDIIQLLEEFIVTKKNIQEFQLFWITKILIDLTIINEHIADILFNVYKHNSSTNVVKCLILELQENNYGLLDLKKNVVRGNAFELVISALVGLISLEKGNRNQIYKYVGRFNPMFKVVTKALSLLECNAMENLTEPHSKKLSYVKKNVVEYAIEDDMFDFKFSDDDLPF